VSEPLSPRAWVGEAPFPWPATHALPGGASVRACYYVRDAEIARTRQDQPYLRLSLSDRHGNTAARVWDNALLLAPLAPVGSYIGVQGVTEIFNGELQLCVEAIAPLHVDLEDLALFLPCSPRDAAAMAAELQELLDSIGDSALRSLAIALLGPDAHTGPGFRLAPAAKHNHHAYLGGLLEHTLSVTRLCQRLADHYGDALDRDLLVTAALLHDVGKVRELGARAGFPYTDEGKLLGHILLGLQMVDEAAAGVPELAPTRLLLLRHVIAAHQGRYEWQSPREPATLEALVLHYADDLDAKYNQVAGLLAPVELGWTPWDRSFRREFLRHRAPSVPPGPEVAASDAQSPPGPSSSAPPTPQPRRQPRRREDGASGTSPGNTPEGPVRGSLYPRLSDDTLDLFERP
jgi:3'-5' exoribonuclease